MVFLVAGVDGGASNSTLLLVNDKCEKLIEIKGPGTNCFLIGITECQKRIHDMLLNALKQTHLDESVLPLESICLSLSGCESEKMIEELESSFTTNYPNLSKRYSICSDISGAISAFCSSGGMVIICGTGSNTLLMNPDGKTYQCGGWGHLLGDEASGWWIAQKAIKMIFDHKDNLIKTSHSIENLWNVIKKYFKIIDRKELLDYFYKDFKKSKIAGLTTDLAKNARITNDPLIKKIFFEAGQYQSKSIEALYPFLDAQLKQNEGGVKVLCMGSVWLSWDLLQDGFVSVLNQIADIEQLTLIRLKSSVAIGAVYLAFDKISVNIQKSYSENYDIFYKYSKS